MNFRALPSGCMTAFGLLLGWALTAAGQDSFFRFQTDAVSQDTSPAVHWGWTPEQYTQWGTHSNRLIPVYTFGTLGQGSGVDLQTYTGSRSVYRDRDRLEELYDRLPRETLNPEAEYMDQTDLYRLQLAAAQAGKKHIFLIVFDGMDWQTTQATSIYNLGQVAYREGRGRGTWFQEYNAGGTSQFGWMVTSPHNGGSTTDVDRQVVINPGGTTAGGYRCDLGGLAPWSIPADLAYLGSKSETAGIVHAYTDSASSATSMTAGIKTYNAAIGVDATGRQVETIAHRLQREGWSVGAVSSVPISHATPAATYAHNVHRGDYQDLTRDLLGLRSISHPQQPLSGLDVLIGTGFGATMTEDKDETQGDNFVPGNIYLTDADRNSIDIKQGGRYVVAVRADGVAGRESLIAAAQSAAEQGHRLFGFYGVPTTKHLPYQTANGDFLPPAGRDKTSESYTPADLNENPTLADMTEAALAVLSTNERGFWLMIEPGDVDWANHDNNLDNSVGAVNSGDAAFRAVTTWVEKHSNWTDSLVILTADHGHMLVVRQPEVIAELKTADRQPESE